MYKTGFLFYTVYKFVTFVIAKLINNNKMKIMKFLSLVIMGLLVISCNKNGATKKPLKTELDSVSYAIGMDVANNVKRSFDEFDNDLFIQGYRNATDSTDIMLDQAKAQQLVRSYFQKKQQEEIARRQEEAIKNKEEGEKFLAENKTKEGVLTTETGLQYMVLNEGTGDKPQATSKVKIHYHGTLTDGTVFDSSVDKGQPIEMRVNQFVKGFSEGLMLMPAGSKYKLFIPGNLGYGTNPPGDIIKPNSVIVFDVELLEILE